MDEFSGNADELIAQMQKDELEGATKLTPREYGKLRGIAPQLVYYHVREGHVKKEQCVCGRSVVDVDACDQYFRKGRHVEQTEAD